MDCSQTILTIETDTVPYLDELLDNLMQQLASEGLD